MYQCYIFAGRHMYICIWKKLFLTSQIYSVLHDDSYKLDHDPNHNDSLMIFKERMIPYYLTFSFHKLHVYMIKLLTFSVIFISYNYANPASSPTLRHLWNKLNYYLTYLIHTVIMDKDTGKWKCNNVLVLEQENNICFSHSILPSASWNKIYKAVLNDEQIIIVQ